MKKSLKLFGLMLLAATITFIGCKRDKDEDKVSIPTISLKSIQNDKDGNFNVSLTVSCESPDEVSDITAEIFDEGGIAVLDNITKSDMDIAKNSAQKWNVTIAVATVNAGWIKVVANTKNGGKSTLEATKLENFTSDPVSAIDLKVNRKGSMTYDSDYSKYVMSFTIDCAKEARIDSFSVQYKYNGKDSIMPYNHNMIKIKKTSNSAWQVDVFPPRFVAVGEVGSLEYYGVENITFIARASKDTATEEKEITLKTLKGAEKNINEIKVAFVTGYYQGDFSSTRNKLDTTRYEYGWSFCEIEKPERDAKFYIVLGKNKEGEAYSYQDYLKKEVAGATKSQLLPRLEFCSHAEEDVYKVNSEMTNIRYFKNRLAGALQMGGEYFDGGMGDFHECESGAFNGATGWTSDKSYVSITKFDHRRMVITGSVYAMMYDMVDWMEKTPNINAADKATLMVEFIEVPLTVKPNPEWAGRIK